MDSHQILTEIFGDTLEHLPPLQPERSVKVTIRLTPGEARRLKDVCQGVPYSTYIRAGLFGYPRPRPRTIVPQINRDTYIELKRQGNNINQQTRAINQVQQMGLPLVVPSQYLEELKKANQLLQSILELIADQPDYSDAEEGAGVEQ